MSPAPIAVSMGEPAGIGPDIILATWQNRETCPLPEFFVVGDSECLHIRSEMLGFEVQTIECDTGLNIKIDRDLNHLPVLEVGRMCAGAGKHHAEDAAKVIEAINVATQLVLDGKAGALVTCPINKGLLYNAGFVHPGHTEYLASLCKPQALRPVMMLAGPQLKTVPVTIHIPVSEVAGRLTEELIVATGKIVAEDLSTRFGLEEPRLAVAGLNPHAGEDGSMGLEEQQIIKPAIDALKLSGINVTGPIPADTMFHAAAREKYDVAICMYHDQALIPAKTLNFQDTVNVTLGLPIIRTSPDHGTAFDIAGTGKADPASFIAALHMASQMAETQRNIGLV